MDEVMEIYLLGIGNVGSALLEIINKQEHNSLSIQKIGSSKKIIANENGINPKTALKELNVSNIPFNLDEFLLYINFLFGSK